MSDSDFEGAIIPASRIRSAALTRHDAFEALHDINPELAVVAYANSEGLFRPEVMPYLVRFRELQSDERIAVVGAMVRKYEADAVVRHEGVRQDGMTTRAGIYADVDRAKAEIEAGTAKYLADTGLEETKIQETGLTMRSHHDLEGRIHEADTSLAIADREATAYEAVQRLKYEAAVTAVQAHVDGQKYLSDNHLRAVHIEAEARRDAIITTEQIRADVERGISQDRLEEAIATAEIELSARVREAEVLRVQEMDGHRASIIGQYIKAQAGLIRTSMEHRLQVELARSEVAQTRLQTDAQKHGQVHETTREALDALKRVIERGDEAADISVRVGTEIIEVKYRKPEE